MMTVVINNNTATNASKILKSVIELGIGGGMDVTADNMVKDAVKILNEKISEKNTGKSTGKLAKSIQLFKSGTAKFSGSDYRAYVFTDINYAKYVEFEGVERNFEGYYFMTGAYNIGKEKVASNVKDNIIKQIQSKFKK